MIKLFAAGNKKKTVEVLTTAVLSVWSSFSVVFLFLGFEAYSQFVLFIGICMYPLYKILLNHFQHFENKAVKLLGCPVAFLLSASVALTSGVEKFFDSFESSKIALPAFAIAVSGIAVLLWQAMIWFVGKAADFERATLERMPSKKMFFLGWAIMLLIWLAFYTCYYPGIITPDSIGQINIAYGKQLWSNHHPVAHTLLIELFMKLGNNNPLLYMLFQMIFMTGTFSYCCYYMWQKKAPGWVVVLSAAFFALHPIHAYSGFTMVKDTLFSGFVLLFSLCLCEVVLSKGECVKKLSFLLFLCLSTLGVLFFRNNGFMAVLFSAVFVLVFVNKFRIRICGVLVSCLALFFAVTTLLYPALNIAQSSLAESLAIPIQQIARVIYENKELDAETLSYINSIIPLSDLRESYLSTTVDVLKFHDNFDINVISSDMTRFLKVWASILIKYPLTYIEAYLLQTRCLWDLGVHAGLIENFYNSTTYTDLRMTPLLGPIAGIIQTVFNISQFSSYAFITTPFWNIAICYVVVCICSLVNIAKKQKERVLISLPVIAVWLSLAIAIPAALVGRYSYSVFTCLPLIVGSCFIRTTDK